MILILRCHAIHELLLRAWAAAPAFALPYILNTAFCSLILFASTPSLCPHPTGEHSNTAGFLCLPQCVLLSSGAGCECVQDTVIEEDKEFVTQYFDMPDTDFADMERMSPWLLRIELNREMLTDKGLNMSRIADTITSEFGDEMSVIFTDDNAPKHILRVGLASSWLWHCHLSAHLQGVAQAQPCSTTCKLMVQCKGCMLRHLLLGQVKCADCYRFSHVVLQTILCLQIRMLGEEGGKDATGQHEHGDDVFLKKIESHLLTQVTCPISTAYLSTLHACKFHVWLSLTSQVCPSATNGQ